MFKTVLAFSKSLVLLLMFLASNLLFAQTPLSGTYTIDPSGNGDYLSFTAAVVALDSFGVSGPTVFEAVNGTYIEHLWIDSIFGTSSINTVTFTSQSSNASNVIVTENSVNPIVSVGGITYVRFTHLTFQNLDTAYAEVFQIYTANNIVIDQCDIIGDSVSSNGKVLAVLGTVNDFSLLNSKLVGGSSNIQFHNTGAFSNNIRIEGNELVGAYSLAVTISRVDDFYCSNNILEVRQTTFPSHAFVIDKINGGKFTNNYVKGGMLSPAYGLTLRWTKGTGSLPFQVFNNRFYLPACSDALVSWQNKYVDFNHNSIYGEVTTGYGSGAYFGFDTNTVFRNNIIQIEGLAAGFLARYSVGLQSDNNCISAPGGVIGYEMFAGPFNSITHSSLSSWSTSTGLDSNSINVNQIFYDTVELRVCTDSLYQKGVYYPQSLIDFQGDVRQNPPCIGADEFLPPADLNMIADTVLCDGDTLNYTFNTGVVVWNTVDTLNSYNITTLGPQTVAAYGGCASDTASFNVLQQQYADINDTNLCDGEVAFYDCGILSGTYQWSNGSNGQITLINAAQTLIVNVVDSSGCASSDVAFITQSTDVDLPDSAIFCTGENVILDANVPTSYVWNTGSTNQSITVTSNGLYSVTVTDLNCVSVDSTYVYEVFNTIPSFTDSSDFFTVWFTNTSQNADTYLWDFGDGTTSTDTHPIHVFPYSTQNVEHYSVTLTAENSCGDNEIINDGVRVGQLVSVSEIELASMISVYPNPNNGVFTVVLKSVNSANVKIQILDVRGIIVKTANLGTIQGNFSQEINLGEVATGIYFVRVILNNESAVYRIAVE